MAKKLSGAARRRDKRGAHVVKGTVLNPRGITALPRWCAVQAADIAARGITPMDLWVMILNYDEVRLRELKISNFEKAATLEMRMEAAEHLAPYVHRRLPQQLDFRDVSSGVYTAEQLATLSDEDLESLTIVLKKLPAPGAAAKTPRTVEGERVNGDTD